MKSNGICFLINYEIIDLCNWVRIVILFFGGALLCSVCCSANTIADTFNVNDNIINSEINHSFYDSNNASKVKDGGRYKRVVLKRNFVDESNVLTQEMLSQYGPNTKFIIKYDFVLKDSITIPTHCVLKFNGGSIRNGTINFNNCMIVSKKKALYNIHFSHLANVDIRYFDIPEDATLLLQDIVNSANTIDLRDKTFNIHRFIEVDGRNGDYYICNGTVNALNGFEVYDGDAFSITGSLFYFHDIKKGSLHSLILNGNRSAQKGIYLSRCHDIEIVSCTVTDFDGTDKNMSWGIRCGNCSNISLTKSYINNIIALPVGKHGGSIGSAAGIVFEHTNNSIISDNIIENIQSTRDGDAVHVCKIPIVDGKPAPNMEELYEDANVIISNNNIRANVNSKRCIKIQANGVRVIDNDIQKLFTNKTHVVSIYGSNIELTNNTIDSKECYTISIGANYLNTIHDVNITNNLIYHNTTRDYGSCIYMVGSSLKNITVKSNTVSISNHLNSFCDLRGGLSDFVVLNNKVEGGSHFFQIYNEIDDAEIAGLQLLDNQYEGDFDFLTVRKANGVKTKYKEISASGNTFNGKGNSTKMFDVVNDAVVRKSISIGVNMSNKNIGL